MVLSSAQWLVIWSGKLGLSHRAGQGHHHCSLYSCGSMLSTVVQLWTLGLKLTTHFSLNNNLPEYTAPLATYQSLEPHKNTHCIMVILENWCVFYQVWWVKRKHIYNNKSVQLPYAFYYLHLRSTMSQYNVGNQQVNILNKYLTWSPFLHKLHVSQLVYTGVHVQEGFHVKHIHLTVKHIHHWLPHRDAETIWSCTLLLLWTLGTIVLDNQKMWFEGKLQLPNWKQTQIFFFPINSLLPTTSLPVIINLYEYPAPLEIYMPKRINYLAPSFTIWYLHNKQNHLGDKY